MRDRIQTLLTGMAGAATVVSFLLLAAVAPAARADGAAAAAARDGKAPLMASGDMPDEYRTASAGFGITRLRIYFGNKRSETTVRRNEPSPPAWVEAEFTGAGLFEGFWEVDGRLLAGVSLHVVPGGGAAVISMPESPGLPTFDPGTHRVRFVVTKPAGVKTVEALYFVTAEEYTIAPQERRGTVHDRTDF